MGVGIVLSQVLFLLLESKVLPQALSLNIYVLALLWKALECLE